MRWSKNKIAVLWSLTENSNIQRIKFTFQFHFDENSSAKGFSGLNDISSCDTALFMRNTIQV